MFFSLIFSLSFYPLPWLWKTQINKKKTFYFVHTVYTVYCIYWSILLVVQIVDNKINVCLRTFPGIWSLYACLIFLASGGNFSELCFIKLSIGNPAERIHEYKLYSVYGLKGQCRKIFDHFIALKILPGPHMNRHKGFYKLFFRKDCKDPKSRERAVNDYTNTDFFL